MAQQLVLRIVRPVFSQKVGFQKGRCFCTCPEALAVTREAAVDFSRMLLHEHGAVFNFFFPCV